MTDTSPFLKTAIDAAQKAEKVIMDYFSQELRITLKPDQSPVTIADQEAEKIIISTIKNQFPQHQILGEETGLDTSSSEYLWIIDPIDGTKNYTRGLPLFATQIALMKDDKIIVGVSNAPAMRELLYAERGKGTFYNGNRVTVSSIPALDQAYLSYGGLKYFQKLNLVDNLLTLVQHTRAHRGIGDFWSYHLLAQGKIDIMIEAETKLWDIAALSIIIEEAGGKVTDRFGNQMTKNTTSLVATNNHVHSEVIALLKKL